MSYRGARLQALQRHRPARDALGIHELMPNDRDLRHLIQSRATATDMQALRHAHGMRTLRQDGIERCCRD
jgi:type II secretory ATPase GspE/PulE/Tfp pilus assembly ATPase PilB-like protein